MKRYWSCVGGTAYCWPVRDHYKYSGLWSFPILDVSHFPPKWKKRITLCPLFLYLIFSGYGIFLPVRFTIIPTCSTADEVAGRRKRIDDFYLKRKRHVNGKRVKMYDV